jgi:hypothetical protein
VKRYSIQMEFDRQVEEAFGYAELGLFQESWACLESIEAKDRSRDEVLEVRLLICTGLGKWDLGSEVVRALRDAPFAGATCGEFHLAHARWLTECGRIEQAKECIRELAIVWPEGRLSALDDPALSALWDSL